MIFNLSTYILKKCNSRRVKRIRLRFYNKYNIYAQEETLTRDDGLLIHWEQVLFNKSI